jgi:hypothetical protein
VTTVATTVATTGPRIGRPWQLGNVLNLATGNLIGLCLVVGGWVGASGKPLPSRQLGWVTVAAIGLLCSGVSNAMWLLAGRRAVGLRRARAVTEPLGRLSPGRNASAANTAEDQVVAAATMTRYHRPSCELVAGKTVEVLAESDHIGRDRQPCGVCKP